MGGSIFTSAATDTTTIGGEVLSEFDTQFIDLYLTSAEPEFAAEDLERSRANKLRDLAISRHRRRPPPGKSFARPFSRTIRTERLTRRKTRVKRYKLSDVKSLLFEPIRSRKSAYLCGRPIRCGKSKIGNRKSVWRLEKGTGPYPRVPKVDAQPVTDDDRPPRSPQSTIYMGMPAISPSDPDFIKFTVMDSLLGGSFGSRITSNIRENKGYTYSPNSFVWNRYKTGYWIESADVTTESTGASIKEIIYEIERLKKEQPSEAELQGIKNYLIGIYVLQNSSRQGVISQLEGGSYNELLKDYLDTYVQKLTAVTAADVSAMARKYLIPETTTIVVVGDKSKIAEQLKPYEVQ